MPLVSTAEIFKGANKEGYAVGAFNVNNLEMAQAILEAAEEERSPVILQCSENAAKYAGFDFLSGIVKTGAAKATVPVALHLDHGKSVEACIVCIRHGFTSVMIDGSHFPFEENVAITRRVVDIAHAVDVSVEAELGRLGGIEDDVSVAEKDALLTDPQEAKAFIEQSEVDALAVAVGTSHGAYKFKGEAKLDLPRIKEIKELTGAPLVLHGASGVLPELIEKANKYGAKLEGVRGVPEESIEEAISYGVNKINIDTDIRLAFTSAVREVLYTNPNEFDPRKLIGPARDSIREVVKSKMRLFGSSGRA